MMLKQSTAVVVSFGPFVDIADGVTLEVGLVSALDHPSTGIMLAKNGGTLTIRHATVTASSYDAHGCYKVTLDTTDTNTLGKVRMIYTDPATCLAVWRDFEVVPAMIYESLIAGSDRFDVNVTHAADVAWLSGSIAASAIASSALEIAKFAADVGTTVLASNPIAQALKKGLPQLLHSTTIDTVTSQTVFTISDGSADPDAYVGGFVIITDASTATQKCMGTVNAYDGALEITLDADPGIFTIASGDSIDLIAGGTLWLAGVPASGTPTVPASLDSDDITAAAANKIADHVRRRTQAAVEGSSDGDALSVGSLYGLIQQGQESNTEDNAGFLTVYQTDGTTELAQRALTTDAAAEPVTGIS